MISVRIVNEIVERLQDQIHDEFSNAVLSNYSHE
jgi:hypothetical protein